MGMIAQSHRSAEHLYIPRLHKERRVTQMIELGAEKAFCVPPLEQQVKALQSVRTRISFQL